MIHHIIIYITFLANWYLKIWVLRIWVDAHSEIFDRRIPVRQEIQESCSGQMAAPRVGYHAVSTCNGYVVPLECYPELKFLPESYI